MPAETRTLMAEITPALIHSSPWRLTSPRSRPSMTMPSCLPQKEPRFAFFDKKTHLMLRNWMLR